MADAERLLNDAQFAFSQISYGDSAENRRHASRAAKLARRIIRSFPASTEAAESHALLRRLGEEAYASNIAKRHQHISEAEHHAPRLASQRRQRVPEPAVRERLDWAGLVAVLPGLPKGVLAAVAFAGFIAFSLFGPFLLVPLVFLALFAGPLRQRLSGEQRTAANSAVAALNGWIAQRRGRHRPG